MELNLWSILYLAYRVAPLMIVVFFIFSSIINQDFKGLVFLVGLIFACFIVQFVGSALPSDWLLYDIELNSPVCNSFSIGQNGFYSNKFPFSIVVFSFSFWYLFYIIYNYGLIVNNIPFMVLFPVLILFDMVWNKLYKCANIWGMTISFIFGGGIGYIWGKLVDASGIINLTYMTGSLNNETCKMASQTQFKCTLRPVTPIQPPNKFGGPQLEYVPPGTGTGAPGSGAPGSGAPGSGTGAPGTGTGAACPCAATA